MNKKIGVGIGVLIVMSVIVFPQSRARGDYSPMTLFEMLTNAEIVVSGEIRRVEAETYELAVEREFLPSQTAGVLTITRIDTRPLAARWAGYAIGQNVVVFAELGATPEAPLSPLGVAGEGELPAVAKAVYVPQLALPFAAPQRFTPHAGAHPVYQFGWTEFERAVAGFYDCYSPAAPESAGSKLQLARRCDAPELASYRGNSWLSGHLAGIADRLTEKDK